MYPHLSTLNRSHTQAIASVLIIIRTHDVFRRVTPTAYRLSGINVPRAAEAALAVSLPMARVTSEPSLVASPVKADVLNPTAEKYTAGAVASGIQVSSDIQLPYDGLMSSDSNSEGTVPSP